MYNAPTPYAYSFGSYRVDKQTYKHTNKQTLLKTFNALRYATTLGNYFSVLLPERDYVTFGSLLSQIRLSRVTFVHPTPGLKLSAIGPISSPFDTFAILRPTCKILRRSSQGNPSVGCVKHKSGSKIERWWTYRRLFHKRYKIRPRVQLMTNRKLYP